MYAQQDTPNDADLIRWHQLRTKHGIKTWIDLVHFYLPGLTDEEASTKLYEDCEFPTCTVHEAEQVLSRLSEGRMT